MAQGQGRFETGRRSLVIHGKSWNIVGICDDVTNVPFCSLLVHCYLPWNHRTRLQWTKIKTIVICSHNILLKDICAGAQHFVPTVKTRVRLHISRVWSGSSQVEAESEEVGRISRTPLRLKISFSCETLDTFNKFGTLVLIVHFTTCECA